MLTFAGKVPNGLKWHPDGSHIVYPLGSTVVVKNLTDGTQTFLTGHTDLVTCVALSKCGRYIASGQKTNMGFRVRRSQLQRSAAATAGPRYASCRQ